MSAQEASEPWQIEALKGALEAPDLLESLAGQAHKSWAGWIDWMFAQLDQTHSSGETFRERWQRQALTDYADLSEAEKESDRIEARRYLAIIRAVLIEVGE